MSDAPKQTISFAEFEIDIVRRRLVRAGKTVPLNAKAFDLLAFLAENAGRVLTKEEILDHVWADQYVEEANLKVQMSALRKVLGEQKDDHRFLVTIPGKGYQFIAEVNSDEREIVIESRRYSRLVVEQEIEKAETDGNEEFGKISSLPDVSAASRRRSKRIRPAAIGGVAVLLALAVFGAFRYFDQNASSQPFQKIKLARVTNSGKVGGAAISPDGKYTAYVLGESEGNSLWVQQVGSASDLRVLPPAEVQFYGLRFSPDGRFIYYNQYAGDTSDIKLFRVRSLGGVVENIPNVIAAAVSFSPDGKRIAYIQSDTGAGYNYLTVADADGGRAQIIARKKHPDTFEFFVPAVWAPDGETILCLVHNFEADASYSSIVRINVRDGSEKPFGRRRWYEVYSLEWLNDESGLLISASEKMSGRNQIWFVSERDSETRQITNDLNSYGWISATADGQSFAALQNNTVNSISVGEIGGEAGGFAEIASEIGTLNPLVWMPDGKIIFRSNKDGTSNLWTMEADGSDRRQLTTDAQVDNRGLCASPDGKYLVFGSWRGGRSNLWRVEAGGANLTQLTSGEADVHPSCSPDNRTVIYQKGFTKPSLWKVPLAGGEPVQFIDSYAKWSAISTDGGRTSYLFMAQDKWRFGIVSSESGATLQQIDAPATLTESVIRWSPDDRALLYIGAVGSAGNLWTLPLDGAQARQLTNFKSQTIDGFAVSPDKKRLAIARGSTLSDVVLISNVR